jgi:hypothetical protein
MADIPFDLQLLNLCAALLLLLSFAMLAQRRIVNLVNLLAVQGAVLLVATLLLAWRTGQHHLYLSAALTLALKVVLLPWILHRLIRRLGVYWDTEPLLNISGTMLVGVVVVVFAFGLAQPISALAQHRDPQLYRHRGRRDSVVIRHDDYAAQSDVAGGRLSLDGERPFLRHHERHLRHADDRRVRGCAGCSRRSACPRDFLLPDPRTVRQS